MPNPVSNPTPTSSLSDVLLKALSVQTRDEHELMNFETDEDLEAEENALVPPADESMHTDAATDIERDNVLLNSSTIRTMAQGVNVQTSAGYRRQVIILPHLVDWSSPRVSCSLGRNFNDFLITQGLVKPGEDAYTLNPPETMPEWICAWIMHSCDTVQIDGTQRPATEIRLSFSNAQKMRAAASWNFGQINDQGNVRWQKNDVTQKWGGNPSVSRLVSQYMVSLKRRKVHAGETACSARAITPAMLETIYHYNNADGRTTVQPFGSTNLGRWEGARARLLCFTAYLLAFTCLLRVDEVIQIRAHEIRKDPDSNAIILTLPFRKTHQGGDVPPFYLYPLPEQDAHLCPVRAYCRWLVVSGIREGPLFPKIGAGDQLMTDKNVSMSSAEFLEMFRNHLIDVDIDPYPYGTHSFRRGGCQYLHRYRRWSIVEILKYLISYNDSPRTRRQDFFNPNRVLHLKCMYCGRSCNCT
ncbi:hypothetical protein DFH07DRAFT_965548 [Mycena maculata]|uniref:DNA breaking-rejoining enzyme n=2 Tax=Mycena maculata TaxID=230809 RepID=A0AAD7IDT0_9AGAR|nr:hypothetical protein DFH07DRAFT_965548 [Mycena maculata]